MDVEQELQDLYNQMDRWETIARMNSLVQIANKIQSWRTRIRAVIEELRELQVETH